MIAKKQLQEAIKEYGKEMDKLMRGQSCYDRGVKISRLLCALEAVGRGEGDWKEMIKKSEEL